MRIFRLIFVGGVLLLVGWSSLQKVQAAPTVQFIEPMLELATLQESIKDVEGRVIVNFWASWCIPCVKELPIFADLNNKYHNWNIKFVNIDSDKAAAESFLQKHQLFFVAKDTIYDPSLSLMRKLKLRSIPTTIGIDKTRGVYGLVEGELTPVSLELVLQEFGRYLPL